MTDFPNGTTAWLARWLAACAILLLAGLLPVSDALAERVIKPHRGASHVNLREAPTTRSAIIGELWQDEEAYLVESTPGWYHVRFPNGGEGFVASHLTKVVEGPDFCRREHTADCP